jgi:hypothetical protein
MTGDDTYAVGVKTAEEAVAPKSKRRRRTTPASWFPPCIVGV